MVIRLEVHYDTKGNVIKSQRKKRAQLLTDTLVNYGVTPEKLNRVAIEVKNQNGLGFWILNLAPFILPLIVV
jgi:hypothetical protein